jgi:hypothetical protein
MSYSLTHNSDELKKLILENPDLPIVVLAGEEASGYDFYWTYCSSVSYHIGEILDCDYYDYDDTVFTDRDRLREKIEDDLYDEYHDKSDEEYEAAVNREVEKYELYWQKVIAIYASN